MIELNFVPSFLSEERRSSSVDSPCYFSLNIKALTLEGIYRGTLEGSHDVTEIRKLEGQQRLRDWE